MLPCDYRMGKMGASSFEASGHNLGSIGYNPGACVVSRTYQPMGRVNSHARGSQEMRSKDDRTLDYGYIEGESFGEFLGLSKACKACLGRNQVILLHFGPKFWEKYCTEMPTWEFSDQCYLPLCQNHYPSLLFDWLDFILISVKFYFLI